MIRFTRFLFLFTATLSIASCVDERRPANTSTAGAPPFQTMEGCGMYLFEAPACEAAFDRSCCAQQEQCANDRGCRRIVECWNYCESRRSTEGCGCFSNCAPQGELTPGLGTFERLAACSKGGLGTPGKPCRSGC